MTDFETLKQNFISEIGSLLKRNDKIQKDLQILSAIDSPEKLKFYFQLAEWGFGGIIQYLETIYSITLTDEQKTNLMKYIVQVKNL